MTLPAEAETLRRSPWLAAQPADFAQALLDAAQWREIDIGTTFNIGGDAAGGIWGLARGQVDVASAVSAPDTPLGDIYLPGQWAGIGPIFGQTRAGDCVARLPSLIAQLPQVRLLALLEAHPAWWQCIGALAVALTFRYGGAAGDLLIRDPRRRVVAVLLRLGNCRWNDPEAPVSIVFTQDQIAAAANLSRHPAGAILRDLEACGLLAIGYRSLTIRDAAALRAIADGG
jgi:CRP/FNR family cyclic AMP-dependent transcriptional regulator